MQKHGHRRTLSLSLSPHDEIVAHVRIIVNQTATGVVLLHTHMQVFFMYLVFDIWWDLVI